MTKKTKMIIGATATVVITAGVALALYLLFRTTETHITTTESKAKTSVLVCQAMAATSEGFFDTSGAQGTEQKVKATFVEGKSDKLNYLYEGTYASIEAASKANDVLHADYNIYMGIDAEKLAPTFSIIDNMLKINLFASQNQINTKTGKLFFLSDEEAANFNSYNDESLTKLYQDKGFACELETK